jgi:competence protein ComEC
VTPAGWRRSQARAAVEAAWRPVHAGPAALVAGLVCGPRAPALAVAGAAVLLALGALLPVRGGRRGTAAEARFADDRAPGHVWLVPAAAVLLLLGAWIGAARVAALEASRLGPLIGRSVREQAVVLEAPRASSFGGWSAIVSVRGEPVLLRVHDRGEAATGGAGPAAPPVGTVLAVGGKLRAAGSFARARHAHAELAAGAATAVGRRGGLLGVLDAVRQAAQRALGHGLPPPAAGLLRGMVLGDDTALPGPTRDAFRAAGLSHLVAASGTNVVLLAALATAAGTALGLGLTGRLWLVLVVIAGYVPLAGGGPSIQRAGVMGAAVVAAGLVGRPASRSWALGLAATATLALDPRAVADPGWQLSFAAVVGILALAGRWRRALVDRGVPRALAEVTAMTAAAGVATAPIVAAHFGQASLVGLPVNLLAAPAVAPVMWLGVAAAGVGQLAGLGGSAAVAAALVAGALDGLAGFPLGYLGWLADTGAALPGAVVHAGPWGVLVASVLLAAAASSRRVRRAGPLLALAGVLGVVTLAPHRSAVPPAPRGLRVTFLDVGQGDATLLQAGGRAVLVDAGPPADGIVEGLRAAGVQRLDALVVTHAQADHLGGAAAVLQALPVGLLVDGRDDVRSADGDATSAAAAARRVPRLLPRAGQVLRLGPLALRVLWPPPAAAASHAGEDPNQRAIVLEADADGTRTLLTADAESDVLGRLPLRGVDVLKVSHHGSADPGLPALLARLHPRVAGIEVGARNTYGHPAPSTLAALAAVPVVVRTDRDGTVRLDHEAGRGWAIRAHLGGRP